MTSNLKICVNKDSILKGSTGTITGNIAFKVDDIYFPEAAWNDFIVVVLSWWWKEFNLLISTKQSEVELRFMDGPFYCRVSTINNIQVLLEFIDARKVEKVLQMFYVDIDLLQTSMREASEEVFNVLSSNGWIDSDTIILKKYLNDSVNGLLKN